MSPAPAPAPAPAPHVRSFDYHFFTKIDSTAHPDICAVTYTNIWEENSVTRYIRRYDVFLLSAFGSFYRNCDYSKSAKMLSTGYEPLSDDRLDYLRSPKADRLLDFIMQDRHQRTILCTIIGFAYAETMWRRRTGTQTSIRIRSARISVSRSLILASRSFARGLHISHLWMIRSAINPGASLA